MQKMVIKEPMPGNYDLIICLDTMQERLLAFSGTSVHHYMYMCTCVKAPLDERPNKSVNDGSRVLDRKIPIKNAMLGGDSLVWMLI